MHHLTVKKAKTFNACMRVHKAQMRLWREAMKGRSRADVTKTPKFYEAVELVVSHGLSHPEVQSLLNPPQL